MPYIKQELRKQYDDVLAQLPLPQNPGELNYVITQICIKYFKLKPDGGNYQTINDIAGALHCAAAEFYERIAKKYEQQKKEQNGDVYPT